MSPLNTQKDAKAGDENYFSRNFAYLADSFLVGDLVREVSMAEGMRELIEASEKEACEDENYFSRNFAYLADSFLVGDLIRQRR